jgi:uncharacterized protein YciI
MYMVEFFNLKPNEVVDEFLQEHRAFLAKHVATGVIIAAGPKVPRDGGIIIVADIARDQLDKLLAEDPFLKRGYARCVVTEFKSNFLSPALGRKHCPKYEAPRAMTGVRRATISPPAFRSGRPRGPLPPE